MTELACRFPVISRCSHGCGEHDWSNAALCDLGLAALRTEIDRLRALPLYGDRKVSDLKVNVDVLKRTRENLLSENEMIRRQLADLHVDQQGWRNGVALIASALGERNPKDLSCVRISENALSIRAKVEEQRVHMEAWYKVFGTTQLTHAQASLEAWNAEHKRLLARLDDQARVIAGLREAEYHLARLTNRSGHSTSCQFSGCTCGKVSRYNDALLDANKFLRETKALSPEPKEA